MNKIPILGHIIEWLSERLSHKQLMYLLSLVIGIVSGLAAVLLKNTAHITHQLVRGEEGASEFNVLYLALPLIGIALTVLFIKLFIKDEMGHGITKVLHSISKQRGFIRPHNSYSSIIASTFTVGFGGSVGLESPIVVTGSSLGSNLGRHFGMNYKSIMTLIGCGAAGAIAGIFKAPIAAVIFSLEVLMLDISMWSIIPLLISAVSGASISYFLLGREATLHYPIQGTYELANLPYYIILGVLGGLVALFFTRTTIFAESMYERLKKIWIRVITGGVMLGILIFIFPPLYGEGYDIINSLLDGNISQVAEDSIIYGHQANLTVFLVFLVFVLFFKPFAMTATTGAGGVGGIFAPTMFMGGLTGFLVVKVLNLFKFMPIPDINFILAGMSALMAGVMHAPLTAIFLIAEVTGGYSLFIPLMITATVAYITVKYFEPHSIYTHRLAKRGELITHNKDKAVLTLLEMDKVIEKDFLEVSPDDSLGKLIKIISKSKRNLYPVISENQMLVGIVLLDDIRHVIFNTAMYQRVFVRDIMQPPPAHISPGESMEEVMKKFEDNKAWNLPVINNGAYIGFLSKSKLFSYYRNWLIEISDE
jgi:CIC family chloride channel protein